MSKVSIRFVTDNKAEGNDVPAQQSISVNVGALRLEGPSNSQPDKDSDYSTTYTSEDDKNTTQTDEGSSMTKSSGASPNMSWDLLLLTLFSGSGCGLITVVLAISMLFGVPVGMIIIGSVYLGIESCFDERIAILLVIGGVLSILSILTRTTTNEFKSKGHHHHNHNRFRHLWEVEEGEGHHHVQQPPKKKRMSWIRFIHGMISLVDCVWLVVTSIFVYRIWTTVDLDNDVSEMYCARTLYLFSFIYLTVMWIIFGLSALYLIIRAMVRGCICVCT